jgi:hypothetical protein
MAEEGNGGQGNSVGLEFNALNHVLNPGTMEGFEMLLLWKVRKGCAQACCGTGGAYL